MFLTFIGIVVFLAGLFLITASNNASYIFSKRSSIVGLVVFIAGLLLTLLNFALLGIIVQLYGLVRVFGGWVSCLCAILEQIPIVGPILKFFGILPIVLLQSKQSHQEDNRKRILIVGLTGAGKSTLIYNTCADKNKLSEHMIHTGAKGNPMACTEYEDHQYIWCDTAGFGEAKAGSWDKGRAVLELIRFLKRRRNGFHLTIFVAHRGRVTEELRTTYQIFNALLPKMTPRILVYTHDMFDYGTDKWFNDSAEVVVKTNNEPHETNNNSSMTNRQYLEANDMKFDGALGVDFPLIPPNARLNDKRNAEERKKISQDELQRFVGKSCTNDAVPLYTTKGALHRLFEKTLKVILIIFTLRYVKYESNTVKWFKNLGMSDEIAQEADKLLDSN